jgi:hypothetical protein
MTDNSPEALARKLLIANEDECRVVVVSRPPGFNQDQQIHIATAITTVLGYVLGKDEGSEETAEVEFMIQVDVIDDGGPDGRDASG